jgi:hypothetical protein
LEDIQFTNDQQKQYFEEAHLGIEFETFLHSNVGRYLQGRAVAQYEDAKEKLLACSPKNERRIRRFQQQAARADQFLEWCRDAIIMGRQAEAILNNEE